MMSAGSAVTGNSRTSLAVPEREYFDNFAFDQVLRHGDLDSRTRLMVQLAALIASQAPREYRVMLGAALTAGVTPTEVKEIVCQAVPYVGMGKVFDVPARGQRGAANRRVKGHVSANLNGQRPGADARRDHPAPAVHRLPAHAQRDPRARRNHPS